MRCVVKAGELLDAISRLRRDRFRNFAVFSVHDGTLAIRQETLDCAITLNINLNGEFENGFVIVPEPGMLKSVLSSLSRETEVELSLWPNTRDPRRLKITFQEADQEADRKRSGTYLVPVTNSEDEFTEFGDELTTAALNIEFVDEHSIAKSLSEISKFTAQKSFSEADYLFLVPHGQDTVIIAAFTGATLCVKIERAECHSDQAILLPKDTVSFKPKAILSRRNDENDTTILYLLNDQGYFRVPTKTVSPDAQKRYKEQFLRALNAFESESAVKFEASVSVWSSLKKAITALAAQSKKSRQILYYVAIGADGSLALIDRYDGVVIWKHGEHGTFAGGIDRLLESYGAKAIYLASDVLSFILDYIKMPTKACFVPFGSIPALVLYFGDNKVAAAAPLKSDIASSSD